MSEVWRAHDDTLDRTVALKILSPTADLDRFRREAKVLATLAHENIMRVYDYGEDEGRPFMALEWLPGGTLESRLAQGALSPAETRRVATGIAAGLAQLHARGLVHRDLKPANVLFDEEGRPKLGDFGLARHSAGAGTLTEAGTVLGTAAYLSPEQAGGEPVGAASDVYSFGVILFRMLTGELPFVADQALALLNMHRSTPPPTVESLQPDAPPDLVVLTAAALRKDPAQRPADGAALLDALGSDATRVLSTADTEATRVLAPPPEPPPARGFDRRKAAIVAAIVVLLALAGGLLAWAVTRSNTPAPATVSTSSPKSTQSTAQTSTTQPTTSQATTTTPTTRQTSTTTPTIPTTVPTTTATIPTTTPTTTATIPGTTIGATVTTAP
jgi:serine/threonine-protein kinase